MSNYNIKLTPTFIDPTTEGSLDSSLLNGKSIQRTFNMYEVNNDGNRKMISAKDGEEFNNTTFQDSTGTGTFEAGVSFAFDPNYVGYFIELSNNNCTTSFTSDADEDETTVLTNYAIKSGEKVVFSMVTTYGGYDSYTGVGIASLQCDVNSYLGEGYDSIGFYDDGSIYFGGPPIYLQLGFQQDGNVVDVAVDRVNNLIWIRVDGGDWNADNTQNPETTSGGIDISSIPGDAYPGACPYAYDGIFGQISINNSVSNPPSGFKVLVGSEQVPLTGYYYFNGTSDADWNNLANWWLDGVSTIAATTLPSSTDNVKIFADVQSNGGSTPTVQNMFAISPGDNVNIGIEINVSGTALFYDKTHIYNYVGFPNIAKINGNCAFYGLDSGPYLNTSAADSVVNGDATFYNGSFNYGTITGNAIFDNGSDNRSNSPLFAIVEGDATFNDYSQNKAIVESNAIFNNTAENTTSGTVVGNATFNAGSNNHGTVNGTVICNTTGTCQTNPYFHMKSPEASMDW